MVLKANDSLKEKNTMVSDSILKKKILITGGLGFLGVNLTEKLLGLGVKPFILDIHPESIFENNFYIPFKLPDINYFQLNLKDKEATSKIIEIIKPDVIVHAAALTNLNRDYKTAIDTIDINIKVTLNILESLKEHPSTKLIFISTSDLYGEVEPPFREDQLCYPASPYSISKLTCENFCIMYSNINKFPLVILRIFNIFGKYQREGRLIPYIIKELLQNKPVKLTPGEQKREYNYIGNISDAIVNAIENSQISKEIINIGSGISVKIKDVALKIAMTLEKPELLEIGAIPYRKNEIWDMYCDNNRALTKLNWKPTVDFDEGLRLTIEWFKKCFSEES